MSVGVRVGVLCECGCQGGCGMHICMWAVGVS